MLGLPIERTCPNVRILYRDAAGELSERTIHPLEIDGEFVFDDRVFWASHIYARCMKAKARRTFKIDRIDELMDPNTGEILTKDEWLKSLPIAVVGISAISAIVERDNHEPKPQQYFEGNRQKMRWSRLMGLALLIILCGLIVYYVLLVADTVSPPQPIPHKMVHHHHRRQHHSRLVSAI